MTKQWQFLTGDVNWQTYGGKWYKLIDNRLYHVIDFINLWDVTGDESTCKYSVDLQEIDLDSIPQKEIDSALSCCGWSDNVEYNIPKDLMLVESISIYGCYVPMGQWEGNNYSKLLQQAKEESKRLGDDNYHKKQLNRPVNKLGSTAREMGQGDFISAMIRGIANDNPDAKIIGKMNGLNQDDIQEIKSIPENKQFGLWDN